MTSKLDEFRKIWKNELLKDVRKKISLAIELLKMELMTVNKTLNDLETSCKFLAEKYDALMTSIHDLKKHNKLSDERIDGVIADVNGARNDTYDNQLRLDASEQYGRCDTLKIQGIPAIADDNPTQLVIGMARLVDVGLESKDISIAHRLPVRNGQSKIIVKFTRRTTRDKNHKKLKSKRTKDLPSFQAQPETSSVNHNAEIHINESLTLYRKRLFSRILEFK